MDILFSTNVKDLYPLFSKGITKDTHVHFYTFTLASARCFLCTIVLQKQARQKIQKLTLAGGPRCARMVTDTSQVS